MAIKGKAEDSYSETSQVAFWGLVQNTGAGNDLQKIMNNTISKEEYDNFPKGSNAFATAGNRTASEETFLAINSHQPIEGWYS